MEDIPFNLHPKDFGNDTVKMLSKRLIRFVLGTVIVITIKTKPGNKYSEIETIQSILFKFADSLKNSPLDLEKDMPLEEDVSKILDRCELLQQKYADFLERAKLNIDSLRKLYDKKDYDLYVAKTVHGIDELDDFPEDESFVFINSEDTEDDYSEENHLYPEVTIEEYPIVDEYPKAIRDGLLIIGPNGTIIKQKDYETLQPKGPNGATRFLCELIFGEETLATHSLTGTPSPAFRGRERPAKKKLDPLKTDDITKLITSNFNVSQQMVRSVISMKCTDTVRKIRRRLTRSHSL